jgi:hypothetical protein
MLFFLLENFSFYIGRQTYHVLRMDTFACSNGNIDSKLLCIVLQWVQTVGILLLSFQDVICEGLGSRVSPARCD